MNDDRNPVILVIEDNPEDFSLFVRACRKNGIDARIEAIVHGDEALGYLADLGASGEAGSNMLMVLDLALPGADGHQILEALRSDERLGAFPVVVLTSSDDENDVRRARQLGVDDYIRKPSRLDGWNMVAETVRTIWTGATLSAPPWPAIC